jgi:hypothetical protein
MFTAEIPVHLIEAAKANLAHAANLTPDNLPKLPRIASYPKPIKFIADALRSGGLILFIYAESRDNVVRLPAICTHEVLERAGFFRSRTPQPLIEIGAKATPSTMANKTAVSRSRWSRLDC